ncbi:DNA repair helicase [Vararia minispora EC-137]|uniref:DNA repair helicase n=1 Tax=Vararia minispora EC-137 TaxID=1314806 RepID=A0ACB8QXD6_9AGAM|nr:DNA repair helicase [Vararia minispora EC-137]
MNHAPLELRLETPNSFPKFPYNLPYDIQVSLMRHLYTSIENRKVAIIESPTGTGKTSSLLCAAITWLDDHRDRARRGQLETLSVGTSDGEPAWVLAQTRARLQRQLEAEERDYEEKLSEARRREEAQRRMSAARARKKQRPDVGEEEDNDDIFLPDEGPTSGLIHPLNGRLFSSRRNSSTSGADEDKPACTKVFYASRTHSQLAQVIPELKKLRRVKHPPEGNVPTVPLSNKRTFETLSSSESDIQGLQSRVVTLGSRKQLCINEELKAKSSDIDESCRELLQAGSGKWCPYLPKLGEESRLHDFRDQILASPKDIEDLVVAGQSAHTCPYFASRAAIPQAELVTLPYNLLLQSSAREALKIDLTGHVIIVDEAHNLTSSLLDLTTAELPLNKLDLSIMQLGDYLERFGNRLASRHRLHLQRLHLLLKQLQSLMLDRRNQGLMEVTTVPEVLSRLGRNLDGVNIPEIVTYLKTSRVARKIASYSLKKESIVGQPSTIRRQAVGQPPLFIVQDFVVALAEAKDADGRIVFTPPSTAGPEGAKIKYQSLNPAPHFREVVETARSVILAGGTMSPMSDLINNLFRYTDKNQIATFSCGHIIPKANLRAVALKAAPSKRTLKLSASSLQDHTLLSELGQTLLNFTRITPGGMVVFFPTYKALNQSMKFWKEVKLLDSIHKKKQVFTEPSASAEVPAILHSYSSAIHSPESIGTTGAILFAVVGAKLSEGLNFSDNLARMVVIIGLPFPNLGSPELQERLKYADRLAGTSAVGDTTLYGRAGLELYENICMNSVNQSIGRAIRHKDDWAALVLIDERYHKDRILKKLPRWIEDSVVCATDFKHAFKSISEFYSDKRSTQGN